VDGVEERPVQLVEQPHGVEGVEDRRIVRPALVEDRRDAPELDILRKLLQPGLDLRLEVVAMNAAVPEELEHLDLACALHLPRRVELDVGSVALRAGGERREGEEGDDTAAYPVHCWSLTLIRLASIPLCASAWRTLLMSSSLA
jgi:hypothetical protein